MGKSKKKRFGAAKPQPTGLPSVGELEAELEITGEVEMPGGLQAIVEKLQSPSMDVRECGCSTIASIVSRPADIRALLDLNVLKILAPLMLDNSLEIRHRAVGALRNLSVDGGPDVCEEMVAKDVMTPVVALIKQYGADGAMKNIEKKKEQDVAMDICTQAMYLLLNLCENSGLAVSIFNRENLLAVVGACLTSDSVQLHLAAAQCLHTVTEDNPDLASMARQLELSSALHKMMLETADSSEKLLIRTLCTGILVNMESNQMSSAHGDLVSGIVTSVCDVLSVDVIHLLMKLHQTQQPAAGPEVASAIDDKIPVDGNQDETSDDKMDTSKGDNENKQMDEKIHVDDKVTDADVKRKEELEKSVQDILNVLTAQKVALEIIANLCCSEDEEWEDLNSSESSSSDDLAEVHVPAEDIMENGLVTPLCIPTEIHTAFVSSGIVSKVLQAAQPLGDVETEILEKQKEGKKIVKRFTSRQTHALLCINNLVSSLETEAVGGVDKLLTIWQGLGALSKSQHSRENLELLEAITSAMRAVVQKLAEAQADQFPEVTPGDLQFLFEMGRLCQWAEIRVNSVRIVSIVGSILAKVLVPHPLLKDIGKFLLEVTCKDTELWVIAEALDAIFDVFSEDHVDPVVKEIGLVESLKTVVPVLKSKVNGNRKSLGEHYPVIMTARTNLVRYIKYKSSH